jgi:hypothetical protein
MASIIRGIVKTISVCLLLFIGFGGNSLVYGQEKLIRVSEVTNEIRLGQFAGNRNMSVGVKNIIEEILLDLDYDLSPVANQHIKIRLVFFDVKNLGSNVAVFHKNVSVTQIIAQGELYDGDKLLKKSVQKGESKEISQSTLLIAEDGTFNQQTASIALKKVCELIVKDLTK